MPRRSSILWFTALFGGSPLGSSGGIMSLNSNNSATAKGTSIYRSPSSCSRITVRYVVKSELCQRFYPIDLSKLNSVWFDLS